MINVNILFDDYINKRDEERKANHTPSGKLSASQLGYPTQWQVLKYLQVNPKPFDEFTLYRMLRGVEVEDRVVEILKQQYTLEQQVKVEFMDAIGYLDILLDDDGVKLPIEVKSVANSKFAHIKKSGADLQHVLQACFYALGLNLDRFSILYVSSDDYQRQHLLFNTNDYEEEVINTIKEYNRALDNREIPLFEAKLKWQENPKYNNYDKYMSMDERQLKKLAKKLYDKKESIIL